MTELSMADRAFLKGTSKKRPLWTYRYHRRNVWRGSGLPWAAFAIPGRAGEWKRWL